MPKIEYIDEFEYRYESSRYPFNRRRMHWWVVIHVIGTVFGVGAATINDILFMRAIGSSDEGRAYQRYAPTLSLVAWTGVLLLLVSAFAFWREHPAILQSQKILVKIALAGIVTVNGALMGVLLMPRVHALRRQDWTNPAKLQWAAGIGTVLGAISIVTWYTLLILGAVGRTGWTASQIVPWYLGALIVAWIAGRFLLTHRLKQLRGQRTI